MKNLSELESLEKENEVTAIKEDLKDEDGKLTNTRRRFVSSTKCESPRKFSILLDSAARWNRRHGDDCDESSCRIYPSSMKDYQEEEYGVLYSQIIFYDEGDKKRNPITINKLTLVQMPEIDFEEFKNLRSSFSDDEWIDIAMEYRDRARQI